MSGLQVIELAAGAAVVAVALLDVFATLLVPGPVTSRFNLVIYIRRVLLPVWLRAARGSRPSNSYAPFAFLVTFVVWGLALVLGFGLMFHALAAGFTPRLDGIDDGMWVAGLSLLTLGVSEFEANGVARGLILIAGLAGFGALTTAITFIFQVESGLSGREPAVLGLPALAGAPPSGVRLLEEVAALCLRGELPRLFDGWRDWAAGTMHSHLAFPVLNYFRSLDGEGDWLTALEAVLDASVLLIACTDERDARGAATLLHRTGSRTVEQLVAALRLRPGADPARGDELADLLDRLGRAGYAVREEGAAERFSALRAAYAPHVATLARHLGGARAPLLPAAG